MRRALAIALLIGLFAPALAPSLSALTADSEAGLPPCCRSHGAHHCAMVHWMLRSLDSGSPEFTAAPCLSYPAAVAVPQLAVFALIAAPQLSVEPLIVTAPIDASSRAPYLLTTSPHRPRGPPLGLA
jgi:hypothetical protein